MGRCCPGRNDPEAFQRTLGLIAVWLFVAITAFAALSWYGPRLSTDLRRHRHSTSAPEAHESHPMPRVALDRG